MDKALALFDFDGTITCKDTLLDFMMYVKGTSAALTVFLKLIPSIAAFKFQKITNQTFKERFLTLAFKGLEETMLRDQGREYAQNRIPTLIRPGAMERLKWHRERNHRIVIVSASTDIWLSDWCGEQKIELICSALEFSNGRFTGRLNGFNCRGAEKVRRVKREINTSEYDIIYAYGDSSGDTEMLEFADKAFFRPFHRKQTRVIC
jgi:phosphatidylglycerophosphatase C